MFRRLAILALISGLFLVVSPRNAAAQVCANANPNDYNDDYADLQDCLDNGGTITLTRGNPGYILSAHGLYLHEDGTILTSSGDKAIIVAASGLSEAMLRVEDGTYDYEISEIIFDGNKGGRTGIGSSLCVGYRGNASNLLLKGHDYLAHHIDTINALCGSAMEIDGADFEIWSVYSADNGFSGAQQGWSEPWADGMTVTTCDYGYVHDNWAYDNTDIGIAVGEGTACNISSNEIYQTYQHAIAGFHVGDFQGANISHSGANYYSNTIESGSDLMEAGLVVGFHPWNPGLDLNDAGSVTYNSVDGAVVNLTIDGVYGGTVDYNNLSNPQGSDGMGSCTYSGNFTLATSHVSGVSYQGGSSVRYYDNGTACHT